NLARYNYRKKKFKEAKDYFNYVDVYDLTPEEKAELRFKRGYSYFELSQKGDNEPTEATTDNKSPNEIKFNAYTNPSFLDSAKKDLYDIKDIDTRYTYPAKFYYSHIAYTQQNYETALQGFLQIKNDEDFGP